MSDDAEPVMMRASQWAVDWAVNCPYCDDVIEALDQLLSGEEMQVECVNCGREFVVLPML